MNSAVSVADVVC